MSSQGEIYQNFYSTLKDKIQKSITISQTSISAINNETLNHHDLIISIGHKSAKAISKFKIEIPVVYSLISADESLRSDINCKKETCYKIYINQHI